MKLQRLARWAGKCGGARQSGDPSSSPTAPSAAGLALARSPARQRALGDRGARGEGCAEPSALAPSRLPCAPSDTRLRCAPSSLVPAALFFPRARQPAQSAPLDSLAFPTQWDRSRPQHEERAGCGHGQELTVLCSLFSQEPERCEGQRDVTLCLPSSSCCSLQPLRRRGSRAAAGTWRRQEGTGGLCSISSCKLSGTARATRSTPLQGGTG